MKYKNLAGTIDIPCYINYSKIALDIYGYLNPQNFYETIVIEKFMEDSLREIYKIHKQEYTPIIKSYVYNPIFTIEDKVLLAFSAGLDSMYQAFQLRDKGFNVILFHCKNMNYYSNGKEYEACINFVNKYNFPLVECSIKANNKKDNPYRKYWKENSFKNILLYTMMLDYCLENNIGYISSGDDLRLDIKDAIVGTNIADAYQVNKPLFDNFKKYFNLEFIPVDKNIDKARRIKYLQEKGAIDMFYSCVNPGRFNQSNHNRINKKYNIQMEKWNCGVCRKCAFHSLLRYYYLNENYPQEFIDFCWGKICIGADYEFFKPTLPLEQRIKNLIEY